MANISVNSNKVRENAEVFLGEEKTFAQKRNENFVTPLKRLADMTGSVALETLYKKALKAEEDNAVVIAKSMGDTGRSALNALEHLEKIDNSIE